MNKSGYIIGFVSLLTGIVALVLSLLYSGLKETHKKNELLFEKRAILSSVQHILEKEVGEMNDNEVQEFFIKNVEQQVINQSGDTIKFEDVVKSGYKGGKAVDIDLKIELAKSPEQRILPVYIFKDKSGEDIFIVKMIGKGLWDEISGYLAFEKDRNTVYGASFDHKSETPGMGAEMKDNPKFPAQFAGKKVFDESGKFVSIKVRKGGAVDKLHDVDGISGATLTGDGITKMLSASIANYEAFLKKSSLNKK
ncbi:MAG: NADH:ubiquinone reductase (Na(+)-transporting) subunit C [Saprospiraceae bacterium]|nr:NADH:ubiquinone reductase (Na(+)-transporting) subunit C [Saprospiraceae bacterium]